MAISFGWRVPATQDDQVSRSRMWIATWVVAGRSGDWSSFSSLSFPSLRFLGVGKTRWVHQQMSETRQAHQKRTKWSSKCSLSRKGLLSQRSAGQGSGCGGIRGAHDSITRHQSSPPLLSSAHLISRLSVCLLGCWLCWEVSAPPLRVWFGLIIDDETGRRDLETPVSTRYWVLVLMFNYSSLVSRHSHPHRVALQEEA
jgi:hypothetical protein